MRRQFATDREEYAWKQQSDVPTAPYTKEKEQVECLEKPSEESTTTPKNS
jgi:hypothetical protein